MRWRARSPSRRWPSGSGDGWSCRFALFVLPVLLVAYGLAPALWWSIAAFVAVGAGYIAVLSGLNTVVQLRAPAEVRGRVLGIYMVGLGIVYPIGAVVQGWVGDHIGVRAVTIWAALILLGVMAAVAGIRPRIFTALGDPIPAGAGVVLPSRELP